jgi:hypothetical protein
LSASDISNAVQAYNKDKSDKGAARLVNALNGLGSDWTASGDVVRAGVQAADKAEGKEPPSGASAAVLNDVVSVSRTGNNVTVTNQTAITLKGVARLGKTISFTVASVNGKPALRNIQGVELGVGFLHVWVAKHDWGP